MPCPATRHAPCWAPPQAPAGSRGAMGAGSHADTAQEAAMNTQCRTKGCTGHVLALGLCSIHYRRARAKRLGACTLSGCTNPQHSRGMCNTHYQAMRKADACLSDLGTPGFLIMDSSQPRPITSFFVRLDSGRERSCLRCPLGGDSKAHRITGCRLRAARNLEHFRRRQK